MIHAIVGVALPLIGVVMMTRFFGEERSIRPALQVLPLTLFAWASFVVPYLATAYFGGPTFPGFLGPMVGLFVVGGTLQAGYFLPEEEWSFPARNAWPDHWVGRIEAGEDAGSVSVEKEEMSLLRVWLPYILTAALLVVTRVWEPVQRFLTQDAFVLTWTNILGSPFTEGVELFYLLGTLFVVVVLLTYGLHGMSGRKIKKSWMKSGRMIVPAVVALIFAVATVMIMQKTGAEAVSGTADRGMLEVLSRQAASVTGRVYPFFSGFIGALGYAGYNEWRFSRKPDCDCETALSPAARRSMLGLSAGVVGALIASPYLIAPSTGGPTSQDAAVAGNLGGSDARPVSYRQVVLEVEGMTCKACPITVRKALEEVEGVYSVEATYEPPEAIVRFDPATTSVQALTRVTKNAGYPSDLGESP